MRPLFDSIPVFTYGNIRKGMSVRKHLNHLILQSVDTRAPGWLYRHPDEHTAVFHHDPIGPPVVGELVFFRVKAAEDLMRGELLCGFEARWIMTDHGRALAFTWPGPVGDLVRSGDWLDYIEELRQAKYAVIEHVHDSGDVYGDPATSRTGNPQ